MITGARRWLAARWPAVLLPFIIIEAMLAFGFGLLAEMEPARADLALTAFLVLSAVFAVISVVSTAAIDLIDRHVKVFGLRVALTSFIPCALAAWVLWDTASLFASGHYAARSIMTAGLSLAVLCWTVFNAYTRERA